MSAQTDAYETLLQHIAQAAANTVDSRVLLRLAEAYAWVIAPNNSHGGSEGKTS